MSTPRELDYEPSPGRGEQIKPDGAFNQKIAGNLYSALRKERPSDLYQESVTGEYKPYYEAPLDPSPDNLPLGLQMNRNVHLPDQNGNLGDTNDPWNRVKFALFRQNPLTFGLFDKPNLGPENYSKLNPWHYYAGPQLHDWRDCQEGQTPAVLLKDNYKPITAEEIRAYTERREILGRNRRYFWKMKWHPKHGLKNFWEAAVDAQFTKYNKVHTQFYMLLNYNQPRSFELKMKAMWTTVFLGAVAYDVFWRSDAHKNTQVEPACPKFKDNFNVHTYKGAAQQVWGQRKIEEQTLFDKVHSVVSPFNNHEVDAVAQLKQHQTMMGKGDQHEMAEQYPQLDLNFKFNKFDYMKKYEPVDLSGEGAKDISEGPNKTQFSTRVHGEILPGA